MIREVNLLGYLPLFMQEYLEIRQIMLSENPEFQLVEDESEIIKNNQFISTCNENGICRYEDMLGIIPKSNDTLNERIIKVLIRWNNTLPYTIKALNAKLKIICSDKGSYEIIPDFNNYKITLIVSLSLNSQLVELEHILHDMLPANIDYLIKVMWNQHKTLIPYIHSQLSIKTHKEIREEEF